MDQDVSAPRPPVGAGVVLDERYELVEPIGRGGTAEVWRARDTRLSREVAVKVLSAASATDPAHRNRLEREARALAALAHPNVVHIYDYGEQPSASGSPMPFIVMELVAGPDLQQQVSASGPLEPAEAAEVTATILEAVEEAHRIGIVHGDLKPANVYMAPQGPKVGDFGVARILAEETGHTVPTATPSYAPPELLRGERPGPAADVYAAACIAFELLTGRPPFVGDSFWSLSNQHLNDPPPDLRELVSAIPAPIAAEVMRGLAKDPSDRPASASAYAQELREAAQLSAGPVPVASAGSEPPEPPVSAVPAVAAPSDPAPPEPPGSGAPAVATPSDPEPTVPVIRESTQVLPSAPPRRSPLAPVASALRRVRPGPVIALLAVLLLAAMKGQATATASVPELVGRPHPEAAQAAVDHGFRVQTTEVDEGGAPGTVVAQDPPAGTLLARTGTIRLVVTRGSPQVVIPEVAGQPLPEARATLEGVGLTVAEVLFRATEEVAPGTVLRTDPPAGSSVDGGSPVSMVVAAGVDDGGGDDDGGDE
ncbi:MAG TPA: PASTA domain-containing protein, partial [Actinomycetota bacterium]|nr:PASTA domain-containing protein [Actinomycetota bacterium]